MTRTKLNRFWWLLLLLFSTTSISATTNVVQWTQNVLLDALTIKCEGSHFQFPTQNPNFTKNAWQAFVSYLKDYEADTSKNSFDIDASITQPAKLVKEGILKKSELFPEVHHWQIQQQVKLSPIDLKLDIHAFVIKLPNDPNLYIQALSMKKL